ncbi:putative selenate ABC transporter substrate-binding protein [Nocardioides sp. dk4132]|uniref:putative selenate ABC transporter substrate-binding protein n=1 Tax=unclassified Nocardioides TaxID=2615069 RepID=UPI00129720B4|nr:MULTISPECIES: putative selenate ABC transporter substrate-binding protein [unclassified Nocardioides]MQW76381.1 putative selenate ABC transporter substrate-binding protein [Nocardioides sp. dk4132]QGA07343.1 putative selenate ABC transporter substrate-binding protein [Nocardioides sp. dk884]
MSPRACAPVLVAVSALLLAGCGGGGTADSSDRPTLRISAIPDQDPAELTAREESLAEYLSSTLDVEVEYVPVTDYAASVSLFRAGDLDLVFYGGLTGVQARLQTPGATLLAQRDIDAEFRSVFIANADAGIDPVEDVAGLTAFEGTRFTFGSESSTSGRLMPEYFLGEAGLDTASDFAGRPGYSGSHDATIDLVEAGSYEGGVLNVQVWEARNAAGTVDRDKVVEVFTTPIYSDYHWLGGPGIDDRLGEGFTDELGAALLDLDGSTPQEEDVLEKYGAGELVPTDAESYDRIEEIGRQLGLVS